MHIQHHNCRLQNVIFSDAHLQYNNGSNVDEVSKNYVFYANPKILFYLYSDHAPLPL